MPRKACFPWYFFIQVKKVSFLAFEPGWIHRDGISPGKMKKTEKYGCFAIYRQTSYEKYWMILIRVTKGCGWNPEDIGRVLKETEKCNDTFLTAHCGKFHLKSMVLWFRTINYLDPGKNLPST
jgi:hypothetical protein